MTAVAAVFGPAAEHFPEAVTAMLNAMRVWGAGPTTMHREPGSIVAARKHPWEASLDRYASPLVRATERYIVAADATIYYRDDLRRILKRFAPVTLPASTIDLIVAAADAWGERLIQYLEGDFAIVIWDRRRHRALFARDFLGRRMLYYASLGADGVVVATTASGVVAHPAVNRALDVDVVAGAAAGMVCCGTRTGYAAVRAVPVGVTLVSNAPGRVVEEARWVPPAFSYAGHGVPTAAAAPELMELVVRAVDERTAECEKPAVWMSGGMDSTAVFASGQEAIRRRDGNRAALTPVSLSYPEGDRGREDDFIADVAGAWRVPVRWVHTGEVPLFADAQRRAAEREDPVAHPFEGVLRELARVTAETGSRLALDGYGGDQLFQSSNVALADDLLFGRWLDLARKWRMQSDRSPRAFVRACVLPLASPAFLEWIGEVRGRPVHQHWDQPVPPWIRSRDALTREARPHVERAPGEGAAELESRLGLVMPYLLRSVMWVSEFAMREGVQVRSPLFDRRVIEFAATRPVLERYSGMETKVLLRRAMTGLLPESVLAVRPRRTGVPIDYLQRELSNYLPSALHRTFVGRAECALADAGVVDRPKLLDAIEQHKTNPRAPVEMWLLSTLEVEWWMTGRG